LHLSASYRIDNRRSLVNRNLRLTRLNRDAGAEVKPSKLLVTAHTFDPLGQVHLLPSPHRLSSAAFLARQPPTSENLVIAYWRGKSRTVRLV